ncbi:hypothetical protein LOD99_3462 [Oopsacas minuta]|uniref:BZIP domain-containing protein n=1 Tax=Oopsacas minuta TaxID=111878 RepID=A0AAV7JX88_9METZ|nr:hypothetical protein LOD99_3462 [Oopsacas minuta]
MDEKCKKAKTILKNGSNNLDTEIFFDLVDIDKLINTKATTLNKMLENECFSVEERNFIRRERRKFINRISAKESRIRMKTEMNALEYELDDLMKIRQKLRAEKHVLHKEINDIATKLINPE